MVRDNETEAPGLKTDRIELIHFITDVLQDACGDGYVLDSDDRDSASMLAIRIVDKLEDLARDKAGGSHRREWEKSKSDYPGKKPIEERLGERLTSEYGRLIDE